MSIRFRICMAKGARGSLRPSYRRPKLTLVSIIVVTQLRCPKKLTLCFYGPIALKRIEHVWWLQVLFVSKRADQKWKICYFFGQKPKKVLTKFKISAAKTTLKAPETYSFKSQVLIGFSLPKSQPTDQQGSIWSSDEANVNIPTTNHQPPPPPIPANIFTIITITIVQN